MNKIFFFLTAFILAGSAAFAQMPGDTESMVPGDVNLFIKSRDISKICRSLNHMVFSLMDEQDRSGIITVRNSIMDKTGIDIFDERSLANTGIDTSRPISFANFNRDTNDKVQSLFLPVVNMKEAPLKLIELFKKSNADKPDVVVNTSTATYKGTDVYRITEGIYAASMNGYLVIGSTADIIRRIIDVRESRDGSLMHQAKYADYLAMGKNRYELNAYMTRDFFGSFGLVSGRGGNAFNAIYGIMQVSNDKDVGKGGWPVLDMIDYASAGLSIDGNKIQMSASVKLAEGNRHAEMISGFITTGVHGKSLYVPLADSNLYLSMNLKYLDDLCRGEIDWCSYYNELKEQIRGGYGIDAGTDFIPYHTGGINVLSMDSGTSGGGGDTVVFIPMNDSKKTEELWGKIKSVIQKKYGPTKKFGDEKIGNRRGFWFIDDKLKRYFISYDRRGIYAGSNASFMKSVMASPDMGSATNTGRYGRLLNERTFLLLNIKRNSFLKSIIEARVKENSLPAWAFKRSGEMFVHCEKNSDSITIDVEFELSGALNKK